MVWALVLSLPEVSIGSNQEECFSPPIVVYICSRLSFDVMFVSELLFFSLYQQSRVQSYESLPGEDPPGGIQFTIVAKGVKISTDQFPPPKN